MNKNLKVSVITVCYNSEAHIADCLESVKAQTYQNIEHVIVDGGSTDGTLKIVETYQMVYKKDLIHLGESKVSKTLHCMSESDKGIYDALNKGIARATGDIIGMVHSDDLLADETTIETIVAGFLNGDTDGVYGNMVFVEPEDVAKVRRIWKPGKPGSFQWGWSLPHQTLFLWKEVYERFGGYIDNMTNAADYEFILRICKGDGRLVDNSIEFWGEKEPVKLEYLNTPLIIMKLGGASTKDASSSAKGYKEVMEGMKIHEMKSPWIANTLRLASKLKQRL